MTVFVKFQLAKTRHKFKNLMLTRNVILFILAGIPAEEEKVIKTLKRSFAKQIKDLSITTLK